MADVRYSNTAKAIFAVLTAVTAIGAALFSAFSDRAKLTDFRDALNHERQRVQVAQFLSRTVGWHGAQPGVLYPNNPAASIFIDMPEFWRRVAVLEKSLDHFAESVDLMG